MRFWKELLILALLLSVGMTTFGGQRNSHVSIDSNAASSSTFTVGFTGPDPNTLNPNNVFNSGAIIVRNWFYDALVRYNTTLGVGPDLAQSWTVSPNGSVYTFTIVKNATWSDGIPVTAQDVAFTYNYEVAQQFPQMSSYISNVANATALNNYTVSISMKTPDSSMLDYVATNVFILPQHIWASLSSPGNYSNVPPIGSGPFIFKSWTAGQEIDAVANTKYFGGAPHVQNVVFKEFSDPSTMVLALENGEIDLAGPNISPSVVPSLKGVANIQVVTSPDPRVWYLNFNDYGKGTGNPTLRDQNVRVALLEAMNTTYLTQLVYNGYAQVGGPFLPPALAEWSNPNIQPYPFNLTAAANLLQSSGYTVGSGGIRQSPNGTKMQYTLYVPSTEPNQMEAAQQIQQWWSQIGVSVTPQLIDDNTLLAKIANYSQDMFIWDWIFAGSPNPYLSVFLSSQIGVLSDSGINSSIYDNLYQQALEAPNQTARQQLVYQMQEFIHNNALYGILYYDDAIEAYRTDTFTNYVNMAGGPLYDWNTLTFLNVAPVGTVTGTTSSSSGTSTGIQPTTTSSTVSAITTTTTTSSTTSSSNNTLLYAAIIIVVIVVVAAAIIAVMRRR